MTYPRVEATTTSPRCRSRGPIATALLACILTVYASSDAGAATPASAHADLSLLPLNFEINVGQGDAPNEVQFLAHGSNYGIALTQEGAVLALGAAAANQTADSPPNTTIRLQLLGADSHAAPIAEQPLPGKVNYFIGNDPTKWRTDVATFARVRYSAVYPGVDVVYYGNQGHLEYDFSVAPRANPAAIGVRFAGAQKLHLDKDGALAIESHGRRIAFERPVAYQMDGERRVPVAASYRVAGHRVHFALGAYDHSRQLIIDPVLSYASYLGGNGSDTAGNFSLDGQDSAYSLPSQSAAVDSAGNFYVAGTTQSTNFPIVGGLSGLPAKQAADYGPTPTVFVSKISPDGSALIYSTYLGGSYYDYGSGLAIDAAGNAYVTGFTSSSDFPLAAPPGYQPYLSFNNPYINGNSGTPVEESSTQLSAFVSKLNAAGNQLVYSTYLAGTAQAAGSAIAVDSAGRAYVTGYTYLAQTEPLGGGHFGEFAFPTTAGAILAVPPYPQPITCCQVDAFLSVFDPTGSTLLYSTLYGDTQAASTTVSVNTGNTVGTAVTVDAAGNFYLGGWTTDGFIPTTPNAFQTRLAPVYSYGNLEGGNRGFVAKFSPVAAANPPTLTYGTYLGGQGSSDIDLGSQVTGIAADGSGHAYVTGFTTQQDFPTTPGAYQTSCNTNTPTYGMCYSAYVVKLNPLGTGLLWSTYFGGSNTTSPNNGASDNIGAQGAIVIDAFGDSFITGQANFGLAQVNPVQTTPNGTAVAYAAKIDPTGSNLLFSSLIGNPVNEGVTGSGIAIDSSGNIYVAGTLAGAGNLTATPGAFQQAFGGTNLGGAQGDAFVVKISGVSVATATSLTVAPASASAGTTVTFKATVAQTGGTGVAPTGTVTFTSAGITLGSATLNAAGVATFTSSTLGVGSYSVIAAYSGDSGNIASTSSSVPLLITQPVIGTTTQLSASVSAAPAGTPVIFTATVAPTSGSAVPTGAVTFSSGTSVLGIISLNAGGQAILNTSLLPVGTDSVIAAYGGSTTNRASSSSAVIVKINAAAIATTTSLTVAPPSAAVGALVTFTATVRPASGSVVPTGVVTFLNGTVTLGTGTLNGSGVATFATSTLTAGSYSVIAAYGGSAASGVSSSSAVTVKITAASVTTTTSVTATPATTTIKRPVTLLAIVTPSSGAAATGTVSFYDGGALLGSVNLTGGQASLSVGAGFAYGTQSISAVYAGGSTDGGSSGSLALPITALRGDINRDGAVNSLDLALITSVLNTPASGPNDPRDLNQDGVINALDARIEVTLCQNPGCAIN